MEIRGGNGFIEDWPDARMLRDVSVHAIWEGSGNVIALDVLRALGRGAGPHFLGDLERRAEAAGGGGPAAALAAPLLGEIRGAGAARSTQLGGADPVAQQLPIRRLARRMAILAAGTRLAEQANRFAADTGQRPARLDRRAIRRAARRRATGRPRRRRHGWLEHAEAILNGGPVPLEVGAALAVAVAAGLGAARAPSDHRRTGRAQKVRSNVAEATAALEERRGVGCIGSNSFRPDEGRGSASPL